MLRDWARHDFGSVGQIASDVIMTVVRDSEYNIIEVAIRVFGSGPFGHGRDPILSK